MIWATPPTFAGNVLIGNNITGAGTAEDTLTVVGFVTDSLGSLILPDSLYLVVINPKGDSVYGFSGILAAAEISQYLIGGRQFWTWTKAIEDIDGAGVIGAYQVIVLVVDAGLVLELPFIATFQLNPTFAAAFNGMKKIFYYNASFPSLVDSVGWVLPNGTVVLIDEYWSVDKEKPDSSATTRK